MVRESICATDALPWSIVLSCDNAGGNAEATGSAMGDGVSSSSDRTREQGRTGPPSSAAPSEAGRSTRSTPMLPRTTADLAATPSKSRTSREPGGARVKARYSDMLAAVLAAKELTDAKSDDPGAQAQILALLEPVEVQLGQLNDHSGRLAQFGAGNVAGQAALDMSESSIRSWRQLLALGSMIRADELVRRFQVGAEVIQFLTGEHKDAPTLQGFNHASRVVALGAAAPVLAPPLAALAVEMAPSLGFAAGISARHVGLWAAAHPAASLALSEALLGFGLQIGETGWEPFWSQLHDPQGRWLIVIQILMEYMLVRGAVLGHTGPTPARGGRPAATGGDLAPELAGARQRIENAKVTLQQVSDAVVSSGTSSNESTGSSATGSSRPKVGVTGTVHADSNAATGAKDGESQVLGRAFRGANASHPPNPAATNAMAKLAIDQSTDCSEIAHRLKDVAGSGSILRAEPATKGTLRALEYGRLEGDMDYHEAYTDGAYVFDPRMSNSPIPKSDWIRIITGLNPGVRIR